LDSCPSEEIFNASPGKIKITDTKMAGKDRLRVRNTFKLTFEIPGPGKFQRSYPVEVHEYIGGIGFQYLLLDENPDNLERIAPMNLLEEYSRLVGNILDELNIKPKALVIGIKEPIRIGFAGYEGIAIVGKNNMAYIELGVSLPLSDILSKGISPFGREFYGMSLCMLNMFLRGDGLPYGPFIPRKRETFY